MTVKKLICQIIVAAMLGSIVGLAIGALSFIILA